MKTGPTKDVEMAAEVYQRPGPHDRLIPMLGYSGEGLVREYMEHETVKDYLREHHYAKGGFLDTFADQPAMEFLCFIHSLLS
jgi:hypothetical protein